MGADMLVACFSEIIGEEKSIDFKKGHAFIDTLAKKWKKTGKIPEDVECLGDTLAICTHVLHDYLDDIKTVYTDQNREAVYLEYPPHRIYITGGMSWGDSPTNIYSSMNLLGELNVLNEVGFNILIDYKKILEKILESKVILPMIMGLDPDLDKMISSRLTLPTKRKKKK